MFVSFFRENFLQLDIFYRERSYEQITQQVAYDVFGLLCTYLITNTGKKKQERFA